MTDAILSAIGLIDYEGHLLEYGKHSSGRNATSAGSKTKYSIALTGLPNTSVG